MVGPFCCTCDDFIYGKDGAVGDRRVCEKCIKALADQIGVVAATEAEDLIGRLADDITDALHVDIYEDVRRGVERGVQNVVDDLKHERAKERLARA